MNPDLAWVLVVTGVLGIYAEFVWPGTVIPAVVGSVVALYGIAALTQYSLAWRGIVCLASAGVLVAFGGRSRIGRVAAAAGTLLLLRGAVTLIEPGPAAGDHARIHLSTAIATTIPLAISTNFLMSIAALARGNKKVTGSSDRG